MIVLILVGLLLVVGGYAAPICSLSSSTRLTALQTSTSARQSSQPNYANYAETAFETFINNMYITSTMRLRAQWGSTTVGWYWNNANSMASLLDYADFHQCCGIGGRGWGETTVRNTVKDLVNTQISLSGQNDNQLRNDYMDDMGWLTHALVKLYRSTGLTTYIDKGVVLFNAIKAQDDVTCCGSMNCGIWWNAGHSSKATASQAGAALAALLLRSTGVATAYTQSQWLTFAQNYYSCWRNNMVTVSSGAAAVTDHIDPSGTKTYWAFTYNEGLMLGAAVELFRATGFSSYLTDAKQYATQLMNTGTSVSVNGATVKILKNDCNGCDGDCSQFHGPAFYWLSEYYLVLYNAINTNKAGTTGAQLDHLCDVHAFMKNSIDSMWTYARATTGKFNCNWNSAFTTGTDGLQGSMGSAMRATSNFAALPIFVQ